MTRHAPTLTVALLCVLAARAEPQEPLALFDFDGRLAPATDPPSAGAPRRMVDASGNGVVAEVHGARTVGAAELHRIFDEFFAILAALDEAQACRKR